MKKISLFLCLMPLTVGCATSLSNTQSELDAVKQENDTLRRQLAERSGSSPAQPRPPAAVTTPAPLPDLTVPPPARPQMGPPQNWGWLYVTPLGCNSPFLFSIENKTAYFLRLRLDGQEIKIRGASSVLPMLPPGQTVYVCLQTPGQHQLMGDAYASRFGQLKKVDAFNTPVQSSFGGITVDNTVLFLY